MCTPRLRALAPPPPLFAPHLLPHAIIAVVPERWLLVHARLHILAPRVDVPQVLPLGRYGQAVLGSLQLLLLLLLVALGQRALAAGGAPPRHAVRERAGVPILVTV
jgi:hypothetical protein